jgi:hypothetical protein
LLPAAAAVALRGRELVSRDGERPVVMVVEDVVLGLRLELEELLAVERGLLASHRTDGIHRIQRDHGGAHAGRRHHHDVGHALGVDHYSLMLYNSSPGLSIADVPNSEQLNGVEISKEYHTDKVNDWLVAGLMVYSYSKRLLFEYIRCLPNDSNDVIHIETDGIYFSTQHKEIFEQNVDTYAMRNPEKYRDYPVKFGGELGELKIEKTTPNGNVSYFLGKKFYCIVKDMSSVGKPRANDENTYRVKGIPQTALNADGTRRFLVDIELYEKVYAGERVEKTFSTLRKSLFNSRTQISTHQLTRTIKPNCEYKSYPKL